MPPNREGNFDEYRMLIMESLRSLQSEIKAMREDITAIKVAVGQLQVRASIWGALAGSIGGAIVGALVVKFVG